MEFTSEIQKATYEKVVAYMKEIFGDAVSVAEEVPMISVMTGSAMAFVSVTPMREDEAVVATRAVVVSGAEITPELAIFLLRANASMGFGAFGIWPGGDIVLEHNLLGTTLEKNELRVSILTVAGVADEFDDEIVSRWGGERALDRLDGLARLMSEKPGTLSH